MRGVEIRVCSFKYLALVFNQEFYIRVYVRGLRRKALQAAKSVLEIDGRICKGDSPTRGID